MISSLFKKNMVQLIWRNKSIMNINFSQKKFISEFVPLTLTATASEKSKDILNLRELYKSFGRPSLEHVLMNTLDLSKEEAKKIVKKNSYLISTNTRDLQFKLNVLKEECLQFNDEWVKFCEDSPHGLIHRINMMKEFGIPLTYVNVGKYRSVYSETVRQLRQRGMISAHLDIPRTIFEKLEAPQRVLDMLPNDCEERKINELYPQLVNVFLKWQLGMDDKMISTSSKTNGLTYRSFNLQLQIIDLFKRSFNYDNKKLRSRLYLLAGLPSIYEEYLNCSCKTNGVATLELGNTLPSIMRRPLSHIKEMEIVLNFIHTKPKNVMVSPSIYTYSVWTIMSRIEYFIKKTSLADLRLTPNFIVVLVYFKRCSQKLDEYESKFGSVCVLPSAAFLANTNLHANIGRLTKGYISLFLKSVLDIKTAECQKALRQLQFFHYPEPTLKENLVFLVNKGFSLQIIQESFHILLYPNELVCEVYRKELFESKYALDFRQKNDFPKLLQMLLYKVNKSYIDMGGAYNI